MLKNLKFMNKDIQCKRCKTSIKLADSFCPECGKKNNIPKYMLIGVLIAVLIVVIIIGSIISSIRSSVEKSKEMKVHYTWPTTGIAALLPKADLEYGKITQDSTDYFAIDLYYASKEDFNNYVNKCKEKGFTIDYTSSDRSFDAKDANGNQLNVTYSDYKDEPVISVRIESAKSIADKAIRDAQIKAEQEAKKQADDAAKAQSEAETAKQAEEIKNTLSDSLNKLKNSSSSSSKSDFRKWVDDYERFMNEYVDFMNNYDSSDFSQIARYTKLLAEYTKWANDTNNLNQEEYSDDDWQYLLDAEMRVSQRLATVSQSVLNQ